MSELPRPRIEPASDCAVRIAFDPAPGAALEAVRQYVCFLQHEPGLHVRNLHPAHASVLVDIDPTQTTAEEWTQALLARTSEIARCAAPPVRDMVIPVCYAPEFAPDLAEVAALHGLDVESAIRLHSQAAYQVRFLGFAPGFPYLGGLPPALATTRLANPRTRVAAGSIAIGGAYAGIYPEDSPGGWRLIGRTPLRLFDAAASSPALLQVGDAVTFRRIDRREFDTYPAAKRATPAPAEGVPPVAGRLHVLDGGLQSTVQDLGRPGVAHLGVSACGAADALALVAGNRLVGNPDGAAAIEMTLHGGSFEFDREALVAATGVGFDARLGGAELPWWRALHVRAGDRLTFGPARDGARCYLCVRGGIIVPPVLGSASTHLTSRLGGYAGRKLGPGDTLGIGEPALLPSPTPLAAGADLWRSAYRPGPFRVTRGVHADRFSNAAWERFISSEYVVREQSNRLGLRLAGPEIDAPPGDMQSEGVPLGAVQIPPGGEPIVLFVEHQTTGGYPVIACVCSADWHRLGQLRPRDRVRFEVVSFAAACELRRARDRQLERAFEGGSA